ncbi:TPA: terminase large subunit [Staphylococcus pseudintermedius]|uniref:terminase TerL endonuclease subunit n=1 Tax=Staphylococcus pseudintermedius TaxID=283734 RepID=UPI0018EF3783|nr:terminase TerL endonuclease subunit [Staphylococcus pseudintermedius]EGQ3529070.1 terminase large subunit [Staphylococcus pseudintermedius]EIM5192017.1 terminase large subunit [Staphylococcus pseudintermedius]EJO7183069.1 terminase large subunit [Staphylococcus pseudintermedius]MBJ8276935.1 terminase large subunit [Staphylococcus pseudintermedius]MCE5466562.1 terminase large subunit [Staphylococcus pseudintermedius]
MKINKHVKWYIDKYKHGEIKLNSDRIKLIDHLETNVLCRDGLYFDNDQIELCIAFIERFYFKLQPFQKFLIAFVFLFDEEDELYFEQFFWLVARGAGKNGLISGLSTYFISELHGIDNYDGTVVANTEKQAKTSFEEMHRMIIKHGLYEGNINDVEGEGVFDLTKQRITSTQTQSKFEFATSNAGSKDGGREGFIIYDEIHRYENNDIVDVFSSGLGKVKHPREFFIGTDGFVREGFLDKMKERSKEILEGRATDDRLFPFICRLDKREEKDDPSTWSKANPMFEEPMSGYGKRLFRKVLNQYHDLKHSPSGYENFMTKRMNLPEEDSSKIVASRDEVLATNRDIPPLKNKTAIGGVDYASIKDFAAVGLLFKQGDNVVWLSHSFARKEYLDQAQLKPPIKEWERQGHLTIVDEPSINPAHIVNWFIKMREKYAIQKVVADNFRMDLMRPLFEEAGFEIEVLRNPKGVHSKLAPRIETLFANHRIIFGDNPLMRWYTNNVAVQVKKDGNKEFIKKDEHRRKTDGFHAFLHALYSIDEIQEIDLDKAFDLLDQLNF